MKGKEIETESERFRILVNKHLRLRSRVNNDDPINPHIIIELLYSDVENLWEDEVIDKIHINMK